MKVKLAIICLLGLSLIACGPDTTDKKSESRPPVEKSKADYHKAALLNVEMGEAYLAQGQITRAKQKFIHALELKPKLPEAHTSIGYFYETVGDIPEAEDHYKQAISLSTGSKGRFYNNYGTFLCRQGRYKEADKAFNSALKDKQYIKTAEVFENAGLCSLKHADMVKAQEYLRTAVRRDRNRATASLELADIEFKQNNYAVAKEYLDNYKIVNNQINSRVVWLELQINRKLGNKNEVASAAMKLKNMFPDSAEYKQLLESNAND